MQLKAPGMPGAFVMRDHVRYLTLLIYVLVSSPDREALVSVERNRAMQQKDVRPEYELPKDQYALVQLTKQRLGLIASASLTCFFFGEVPRLVGLSVGEVGAIKNYAEELGVELPTERTYRMLS